ncbi:hypothetical protein [Roseovarius sp. MMSF_3281]|uniref:hypothetical protein n=1 Tax=Roseovarius sp. MMSF_3281 TaxID=3046694 RepID=UPI00273F7E5A|nr:hypothetical protein [Roseovarius sp. MMSF_3281]
MRTFLSLLVISSMALAGCSGWRDSRANPSNWFGSGEPRRVVKSDGSEEVNPLIPERTGIFDRTPEDEVYEGTPVDQVTALSIEPTPGGAIVRATGLPLRQEAFDVRLVDVNAEDADDDLTPVDGVLTFRLSAVQSRVAPQGPERTRRVHVGRFVSDQTLAQTRVIRVVAARNERVSRR